MRCLSHSSCSDNLTPRAVSTSLLMQWPPHTSCGNHLTPHAVPTSLLMQWPPHTSCSGHLTPHAVPTSCSDHLTPRAVPTSLLMQWPPHPHAVPTCSVVLTSTVRCIQVSWNEELQVFITEFTLVSRLKWRSSSSSIRMYVVYVVQIVAITAWHVVLCAQENYSL